MKNEGLADAATANPFVYPGITQELVRGRPTLLRPPRRDRCRPDKNFSGIHHIGRRGLRTLEQSTPWASSPVSTPGGLEEREDLRCGERVGGDGGGVDTGARQRVSNGVGDRRGRADRAALGHAFHPARRVR